MNDETYAKVVVHLQTMTSRDLESASINSETEIYADLKIYSDDLFEFLIWVGEEFHVEIIVAGGKNMPHLRCPSLGSWKLLRRPLEAEGTKA
jgi:hypothetical protein